MDQELKTSLCRENSVAIEPGDQQEVQACRVHEVVLRDELSTHGGHDAESNLLYKYF